MTEIRRIQVHDDGMIYLPADWRQQLGIKPDDLMGITVEGDQAVLTRLGPATGNSGNDS